VCGVMSQHARCCSRQRPSGTVCSSLSTHPRCVGVAVDRCHGDITDIVNIHTNTPTGMCGCARVQAHCRLPQLAHTFKGVLVWLLITSTVAYHVQEININTNTPIDVLLHAPGFRRSQASGYANFASLKLGPAQQPKVLQQAEVLCLHALRGSQLVNTSGGVLVWLFGFC
jgi:hypothetical protein